MATATQGRKAGNTRKRAPRKVTFEKFEWPEVTDLDTLASACQEYVDFCDARRAKAQDDNKAQYWNGQRQAVIAIRRNVLEQLMDVDDEPEDGDESNAA